MPRSRRQRRAIAPAQRSAGPDQSASPRRNHRWLFRLLAAGLVPIMLLGIAELGLRLAGYGYPTSFFLSRQFYGQKTLISNDKFGWRFFGAALARTPRPLLISPLKPAGTCRVFVFGESAAYGDPSPEFGLPRLLEVLLRDRFPGTRFEVINAAMTGINSHVVLPIARDCANQAGDIWVIYMGNNEVVGPFGSGTIFGPQAPPLSLIRASLALKRTRTGELLANLTGRLKQHPTNQLAWGMGLFLGSQIRADDPRMANVYSHFARNLADILRVGRQHGARIVVSTVVSSLKDCAPFASQHRPGLAPAQAAEWDRLYQVGSQAISRGDCLAALASFQRAAELDDAYAELEFQMGRCCLRLGRDDEARRHLTAARDADTLRFRADTRLNDIIRRTAAGREAEGILLADSEQALARQSRHGIAGEEMLYEHVHLNFEGNYHLAVEIGNQMVKLLPATVADKTGSRPEWMPESECAQRLAWTDWDQFKTLKKILLRLNLPPFTSQFGHEAQAQRCRQRLEDLLASQRRAGLELAAAQYRKALTSSPEDWVLQRNYGELALKLGDLAAAEQACRAVVRLLPQDAVGYLELGLLLTQTGRLQEALEQFAAGLRLNPDSVPLLNGWALALVRSGKTDEAVQQYQRVLKLKPGDILTHLNLATALQALHRNEEATRHLRAALEAQLDDPATLARLGTAAFGQGWVQEALASFDRALRLEPTDATTHCSVGAILDAQGKTREAEAHFAEAVRLDPENAVARVGRGLEWRKLGKTAEAVTEFNEAIRLDPRLVPARVNLALALLEQGREPEARLQFEEVLRMNPNEPTARKYLRGGPAKN